MSAVGQVLADQSQLERGCRMPGQARVDAEEAVDRAAGLLGEVDLPFAQPLLLTRVGGFPEVECAELVPPGDPAALANALATLLKDPPRLERMAGVSRAAYGWDAIAQRTLALYAGLLATQ